MVDRGLASVVGTLLEAAAGRWAAGDPDLAERLTAGAWRMVDGLVYADCDDCDENR